MNIVTFSEQTEFQITELLCVFIHLVIPGLKYWDLSHVFMDFILKTSKVISECADVCSQTDYSLSG